MSELCCCCGGCVSAENDAVDSVANGAFIKLCVVGRVGVAGCELSVALPDGVESADETLDSPDDG